MRLRYGEGAEPVELDIRDVEERQDFDVPPRRAKSMTVEVAGWKATGDQQKIVGIMNLWIQVKRSEDFYAKVKPLLKTGVLVKYPMGNGGIVLNQMRIVEREASDRNRTKKRSLFAKLVGNMEKN